MSRATATRSGLRSPRRPTKEDAAGAARILDRAAGNEDESPTPVQLLRLLVLRADVAGRLADEKTAASALARAAALTEEEREAARDDLTRLRELLEA
ncbi:hypothetical protein GCM10010282_69160 [Streptomyces roseolus]|nr:hypothetical protein GCM10010282_69160 [Streptomyces roseolus]